MQEKYFYSNNIQVVRRKWGSDFLSIQFRDRDSAMLEMGIISLTRYCCPGRIDTYSFDFWRGMYGTGYHIRFFTDTGTSLPKAIKMLQEDLNKPQVVEMLKESCSKKENWLGFRIFISCLLPAIGEKTKSLKVLKKLYKDMNKERLQV